MKLGMVKKLTIENKFVHHTLHFSIAHLATITRSTNIQTDILKCGGAGEGVEKPHSLTVAN